MTLSEVRQSIAGFMERAFVPREIFFRSGDRFRHVAVTVRAQKIAAVLVLATVAWSLYASVGYVVHTFVLAVKEREIERHKLAYFDLLSEVGEYHNQFAKITQDLEANQAYLLSVLEASPEGRESLAAIQGRLKGSQTERARMVIAREGLSEKMARFQNDLREIAQRNMSLQSQVARMRDVVESSKAERDEVAAARERLLDRLGEVERQLAQTSGAKQAVEHDAAQLRERTRALEAERDRLLDGRTRLSARIATLEQEISEATARRTALEDRVAGLKASLAETVERHAQTQSQRDYLQRRVGGLEQRLVDLRDAGQSVIERLSERARLTIDVVEKTVSMTGLEVDALLAEAGDNGLGQGGPFVPAGEEVAEFEPSLQLESTVTMLDQQLDRWTALQDVVRSLPLSAPLDQYRFSSGYGSRRDPVNGRTAKHLGVDFAAARRSPVYATAPGKVVFAGWRGRYGRTVEIDHGYGVRTRYAHLRKVLVKVGQQVGHREKIGLLGSSGRSTGPHVHYEVRYKGRAQNPMKFIQAGNHVFKG